MTAPHSAPQHALIVHGALGRLGSRIVALARTRADLAAIFPVVRANARALSQHVDPTDPRSPRYLSSAEAAALTAPAVAVIDVSSDDGARAAADIALAHQSRGTRSALLICTTALSAHTLDHLRAASKHIPVLVTANTSLGVAAVAGALTHLARTLGGGGAYRAAIIESHHAQKKDAPSGTARRLADALARAGMPVDPAQIFSIRAGDVIGEHTAVITGPGEVIEVTHRATTRDLFASGAIALAERLIAQPPGWHTVESLLGGPGAPSRVS